MEAWKKWNDQQWTAANKVEEYKKAFIQHGIDESILQSCHYYSEQALQHLDALSCREEQKSLLRETVNTLLHRNH